MTVIPFPRTRDRRFLRRHALHMAEVSPQTAEKHLAHQLKIQRQTMEKRGIDPETVDQHVRALEIAIRCEFGRLIASVGGAA